ncbi:hypothetical protein O181_005135 [Austropuccinia psidii MF-1]|uniref:Uncharacterized protein n=1 Tax=Austropuccinia psidii MF-1 TaxID=1389203 RepID=A0A9Q3BID4_9BASI|nr:hypothetical protein [Austropuccinia psidii MF-1]
MPPTLLVKLKIGIRSAAIGQPRGTAIYPTSCELTPRLTAGSPSEQPPTDSQKNLGSKNPSSICYCVTVPIDLNVRPGPLRPKKLNIKQQMRVGVSNLIFSVWVIHRSFRAGPSPASSRLQKPHLIQLSRMARERRRQGEGTTRRTGGVKS